MKKVNLPTCSLKSSSHDQLKLASTSSLESSASENHKKRGGSFRMLKKCLKKTKSHEPKASNRVINVETSCTSDDMNLSKDELMKKISVSSKWLLFKSQEL